VQNEEKEKLFVSKRGATTAILWRLQEKKYRVEDETVRATN